MKLYDTSLKYMDTINAIGGTIVAVLTAALGTHWFLFVGFLVLNIIDYITGVRKSKINYQIVASTKNGTGESLKITDSFVSNTNATGTYDESSMKLYKVSADGTQTEVTDKKPTIKTTDGQQTFTYDNLDKLLILVQT